MDTIKNDYLKETILHHTTQSGLNVYIIPKAGFAKKFALYATMYGSNDVKFVLPGHSEPTVVPEGIAHFLEHKMFEEKNGSIFDVFNKLGTSANAFTNFNTTAFLFSCTDNFFESLKTLIEFVQRPYFTDENVEKEKGIIAQEIKMYDDDPNWRVYFNTLNALYKEYPVKKDIAGTVESISNINKDLLYLCHKTFYTPSNMVLIISGDVLDSSQGGRIIELAEKLVKKPESDGAVKRIYPKEPADVEKTFISQKMPTSIPLFNIAYKDADVGYNGQKLLKKDLEIQIILHLLTGRSSDFYNEMYDKELIDIEFGADYEAQKDYGHILIGGQSKDPKKVFDELNKKVASLKQNGFDESDIKRTKKYIKGRNIKLFNSVENIVYSYLSYYNF